VVTAHRDGMLTYYFSPQAQGGFGSRQPAIAQGEPVSEGQKMLRIPDMNKMLVRAKIHEAMIMNVQAKQKARVLIDGFPGRSFAGEVQQVAAVPSLVDIFSSDVKLFEAIIRIDDSLEGLKIKPQMTARVIITSSDTKDEVLVVPIQSIFSGSEADANRKVYVLGADSRPIERDVTIMREGEKTMSNDRLVAIQSGLEVGDKVVLNPSPLLVGDKGKMKASVSKNPVQTDEPVEKKKRGG
jgi:hypothetical protein